MMRVRLKPGRDRPIRAGHPWVFSRAVQSVDGTITPGGMCEILSSTGDVIGLGYFNPASAICVRVLTAGAPSGAPAFTENDLLRRIDRAIENRAGILDGKTTACRLVNAEGDFLPGLIIDKYEGGLCVQLLTAGMERFRDRIISHCAEKLSPDFIFERSDVDSRDREGLPQRSGLLCGGLPQRVEFRENGLLFGLDVAGGQKTGFFLDQRPNRLLAGAYAKNAMVCDCFAYSGAFSVYAVAGGARFVHSVDQSKSALAEARSNLAINHLPFDEEHLIAGDVFSFLRSTDMFYDLIILDPPKFARHPGEVPRAARGYKDINLLAFKKAAVNGIVFTFSCSSAIDRRLFRQIVFSAAADSGRSIQVVHVLSAGPDHPVNIAHPEGDYLKGLAVRVY